MREGLRTTLAQSLVGGDDLPGHEQESDEVPPLGRLIARRYRLTRLLGRGGHGGVWEGTDSLTGTPVAVKVLNGEATTSQVRREVSALRLLRIPGVVRLFDEGVDRGRGFLVMERAVGQPFPGTSGDRTWSSLAGITASLLETLARVHSAGVVHRDIKPGNVLIDDRGRPTLLDFGLALGAVGNHSLDARMVGTPGYMAPEQFDGREVTAQADLYAVGVMLYDALAGRPPHESPNLWALMYAKINTDAPPLRTAAPSVPEAVASVIDRMIAREPRDRPGSAAEVLRLFRGELGLREQRGTLPYLGNGAALGAVFEAVLAGRSVDLVGPSGSGRTRTLQELAERLRERGLAAVVMRHDAPAFRAAARVVSPDEIDKGQAVSISAAPELAREITALTARGSVLLIDDADELDPRSARVVEAARSAGSIVRARLEPVDDDAVRLRPLAEGELTRLFLGPERVFRLPSDAARALWTRTEGWPTRVADELNAWVRAGLAHRSGEQFAVDREALDRLDAGLRVTPLLPKPVSSRITLPPRPQLPARLEALMAWLTLAWPDTSCTTLAAAAGRPESELDVELAELAACDAARRLLDGRWEPLLAVSDAHAWDQDRRRAAHRALASVLAGGTEHRLVHLVASADARSADARVAQEIASETVTRARGWAARGNLGRAIAALSEGLMAARRAGPLGDGETELLTTWVEMALDEGTPRALDRVYYELGRAGSRGEATARLEALVEAALCCRAGGARALDLIEAIPAFEELSLELRRQSVRLLAARRCAPEREEAVVVEATRWANARDDESARSRAAEWEGRLRYRQQRWADAVVAFEQAIPLTRDPTRVLSLTTGAAIALSENLQHSNAAERAVRLRELAMSCRHGYYTCRAEYLIRTAAYRGGDPLRVDWELVDVVAQIGEPDLEALVCMTEGSIAWRTAEFDSGRSLCLRAHTIWAASGWVWGDALVRALGWVCGSPWGTQEATELGRWATECPLPRVGLQVLGMLGMLDRTLVPEGHSAIRRHASGISEDAWDVRFEMLSVREALHATTLGGHGPETGLVAP